MKKAIAMKCTQEQFEAVKGKLEQRYIYKNCYDYFNAKNYESYLVNNYNRVFSISSTLTPSCYSETEIHETWNEKVFLEACGIEAYSISKDQILKAHNAGFVHIKEWFPEVFKKELVVGKWYNYSGALCNYRGSQNGILRAYGIWHNEWNDVCNCGSSAEEWIEATDEEVFEALRNEAVKRGYIGNIYVNLSNLGFINNDLLISSEITWKDGYLNYGSKGTAIFCNGKWATIIPPITREEAEKRLGVKIE